MTRTAVVLGGSPGIGRAVVEALLDRDMEVLLTGTNPEQLERAGRELGARAHRLRVDVTDLADLDRLAARVSGGLGAVDALFVNAGHARLAPLAEVTRPSATARSRSTRGAPSSPCSGWPR